MRVLKTMTVIAVLVSLSARTEEPAEGRNISVPASVAASTVKNPAITTTGTLTILQSVAFTASATSTTKAAISYSWDFADGSPPDTRQNPSHVFTAPGTYPVTVTISEDGNPDVVVKAISTVITDAVKSARLLASFKFNKSNQDLLKLTGTLRVLGNHALDHAPVSIDIGGILLAFTLNDGSAKITSNNNVVSGAVIGETKAAGSFRFFVKSRPAGVQYEDAKFYLKLSGELLPALADEFIFNRDADRESLRVTAKITLNGALYQSTLSPVFSAKKDVAGNLR